LGRDFVVRGVRSTLHSRGECVCLLPKAKICHEGARRPSRWATPSAISPNPKSGAVTLEALESSILGKKAVPNAGQTDPVGRRNEAFLNFGPFRDAGTKGHGGKNRSPTKIHTDRTARKKNTLSRCRSAHNQYEETEPTDDHGPEGGNGDLPRPVPDL
jgi:hypothetical protein